MTGRQQLHRLEKERLQRSKLRSRLATVGGSRHRDPPYSDIKDYVTAEMTSDHGFELLQGTEPEYAQSLINNVVSKASGVFLWVTIVVKSLLAGMRQGDRVCDLQKQLDLLPPELEGLYERILNTLEPQYLEHAAQLFKLIAASKLPDSRVATPTLLLLSFADEDVDLVLKRPVAPMGLSEANNRAETMRRRLKSRCKGFLEVERSSLTWRESSKVLVQYLHRTVRDYIVSEDAHRILGSAINSSFDAHHRLLTGYLGCAKCIRYEEEIDDNDGAEDEVGARDAEKFDPFWGRVYGSLFHAARISKEHTGDLIKLLDDLDRAARELVQNSLLMTYNGRARTSRTKCEAIVKAQEEDWVPVFTSTPHIPRVTTFVSPSIAFGIADYVSAKVARGCIVSDSNGKKEALLDLAIWYVLYEDARLSVSTGKRLEIITTLLEKEADPNLGLRGVGDKHSINTIWIDTLVMILSQYYGPLLKHPWEELATLMFKHGASLKKNVMATVIQLCRKTTYSQDEVENALIWKKKSKNLYKELKRIKRRVGRRRQPTRSFSTPWRLKVTH